MAHVLLWFVSRAAGHHHTAVLFLQLDRFYVTRCDSLPLQFPFTNRHFSTFPVFQHVQPNEMLMPLKTQSHVHSNKVLKQFS